MDFNHSLAKKMDKDGSLYKWIRSEYGEEVFPVKFKATCNLQELKQLRQKYKIRRNHIFQSVENQTESFSPYEVVPVRYTDDKLALRSYVCTVFIEGMMNTTDIEYGRNPEKPKGRWPDETPRFAGYTTKEWWKKKLGENEPEEDIETLPRQLKVEVEVASLVV